MKIKSLSIDRYGAWSNLRLGEFDDRLTVVFGGNGSAKTTIVRFLQTILYGFPHFQESRAPAQSSLWGGSLTVEGAYGRCTIRRYDDGTRSGRLSLHSAEGAAVDRPALAELLGGVDETTFRLIFRTTLGDEPATEALLRSAAAHGFPWTTETRGDWRPIPRPASAEVHREIERLRERRRSVELEIEQIERDRLQSAQRRQEEERRITDEIDRAQSEAESLRRELQSLDAEIVVWETRTAVPAAIAAVEDRRSTRASLAGRLRAVRGQIARWRKVQQDVRRRRTRLRREMLTWTGDDSRSPAAFWQGAQKHLDAIEQRLESLQSEIRTLAEIADENRQGREAGLRCPTLVLAVRDEAYHLCREVNRHYLQKRREAVTEELRQLRRCHVEIASHLRRLAARRQQILRELEAERAVLTPVRRRQQEIGEQLRQCEIRVSRLHEERRKLEQFAAAERAARWDARRRELDAIQREIDGRLDVLIAAETSDVSLQAGGWDVAPGIAAVVEEASEQLRRLTDGRYIRVHVGHDFTVRVENIAGELFPLDRIGIAPLESYPLNNGVAIYSRSVRHCVHLSLCLALAEAYARRGVHLPLILDDVFVHLDSAQAERLAQTLRDFAVRGRQVLVFTANEEVAWMFRRMDSPVLDLPHESKLHDHYLARWEIAPSRVRTGTAALEGSDSPAPAARLVELASRATDESAETYPRRVYLRRSDALEYAPDIDSAAARELLVQGVASVGEFLALSPTAAQERLARLHVPAETVRRWQAIARLMCDTPGLRAYDARILAASGVASADELERLAPEQLLERVAACLETDYGRTLFRQGDDEELARLASWIGAGRTTQTLRETQKRHGFRQSA